VNAAERAFAKAKVINFMPGFCYDSGLFADKTARGI